ncbi:MAG: hypothetical protein WD971_05460 [Pirellulales bacterium]
MLTTLMHLPILAQATDPWAETFFGLDPEQRFVIMIIAIGCATGVICTIVGCVSSVAGTMHRQRLQAEMKRDMLDRGMSADEIARVVESSPPDSFLDRWAAAQGKKKTG